MTGSKNPFYGKTHEKDVLLILSKPKTEEHRKKMSLSLKGRISPNKGVTPSEETRRRMRVSAIKRIKRDRYDIREMCPSVNKKETDFFLKLDSKKNWDGIFYGKCDRKSQHHIEHLGYFVDYYEPIKNIVVEYDETDHYNVDWKLKDKDVFRQNAIIRYLGCKFFRYNEILNEFYEVEYEENNKN